MRLRPPSGVHLQEKWYCSAECFAAGLEKTLVQMLPAANAREPRRHRLPLGLLMLSEGWISEQGLKDALAAQRRSESGRIGEWLRKLGAATEEQITSALGLQWSRPVFQFDGNESFLQCATLIPLHMLENCKMVPVHYLPQSHHLYIAFSDGIDYSVLYGIEQMLRCRTEPCLAKQSSVQWALEQIRQQKRPAEFVFESDREPGEIARTATNYVARLRCSDVCVARCGRFLWVRLHNGADVSNLLFPAFAARSAHPSNMAAVS